MRWLIVLRVAIMLVAVGLAADGTALGGAADSFKIHPRLRELPRTALDVIAALPEVRRIRPTEYAFPNGVPGHAPGADRADLGLLRTRFGVSGRDVRVGVISIGVRGLAESVAQGFLP